MPGAPLGSKTKGILYNINEPIDSLLNGYYSKDELKLPVCLIYLDKVIGIMFAFNF